MIERQVRVTLPGTMFKRGKRWWWKVQLPGEPKEKARALILPGELSGVTSLKQAGHVALAMWQLAAEREAQRRTHEEARIRAIRKAAAWKRKVRQATREAEKAAAKQRAALEEKLEACRQQVESWPKKLQEARARVDKAVRVQKDRCDQRMRAYKASAASARERAIARIRADANRLIDEQKQEFERRVKAYKNTMTRIWDKEPDKTGTEVKAKDTPKKARARRKTASRKKTTRKTAGRKTPSRKARKTRQKKSAKAQRKSGAPAAGESATLRQAASEYAPTPPDIKMRSETELNKIITSIQRIAYCECCFRNGVPEEDLITIDSGQRLCPACMRALGEKEQEIDRPKQPPA